jgi:hypothetical protein
MSRGLCPRASALTERTSAGVRRQARASTDAVAERADFRPSVRILLIRSELDHRILRAHITRLGYGVTHPGHSLNLAVWETEESRSNVPEIPHLGDARRSLSAIEIGAIPQSLHRQAGGYVWEGDLWRAAVSGYGLSYPLAAGGKDRYSLSNPHERRT